MQQRYEVRVDGRKVATVWLDPERRGGASGRLGPLPAFRAIARLLDDLGAARAVLDEQGTAAPEAAFAGEERALAGLSALDVTLADEGTGAPLPARAVRLLPGRPPRLRVEW